MLVARAPGKLVALGEYAVLDGAPAVVLALDRYVEAAIEPSADGLCRLTTRSATVVERTLHTVPGVLELMTSALGPGAELC